MTTPTTPRDAVARIIDPHALWDLSGVPGFPLSDHYVHVQEKALAKADAILAEITPTPTPVEAEVVERAIAQVNEAIRAINAPIGSTTAWALPSPAAKALAAVRDACPVILAALSVRPSPPGGEGEGK